MSFEGREVVLVTGYPRLLARLVAEELVASEPARSVRMIVREKFFAEANAWKKTVPNGDRLELWEGDAAAIDFGLSGAEFNRLCAEVDYVQHHAQSTYEGADEEFAQSLNVQGARELRELVRNAKGLKRLVLGSTALVSGARSGVFREEDLDVGQSFRTSVERTQFQAEQLLRAWKGPMTIVRPSLLVGHSRTGEADRLSGLYLLVMVLLTAPSDFSIPLPAHGDAPLNLVPVDYVARASVALMTLPDAEGKTFHLVDPTPLPARKVYELLARAAGRKMPRGFIPANVARAVLRAPGLDRFLKDPRAFVERLATPVTYASHNVREQLVPMGIECPSFESYVDVLVAHVRERLAAQRAERMQESMVAEEIVEDPLA